MFALGIYINLAGVLLLLIASTGIYIYLGRRLRTIGEDDLAAKRTAAMVSAGATATDEGKANSTDEVTAAPKPEQPDTTSETMAIPAEELAQIEGIFGVDTYFRTETIPYQQGAIFRGNLRGQPTETRDHLAQLLKERLGDKYRLFLVENLDKKAHHCGAARLCRPSQNHPNPVGFSRAVGVGYSVYQPGGRSRFTGV